MTSGLAVVTGLSTVISPWIGLAGIVPALWFYMGTDENSSTHHNPGNPGNTAHHTGRQTRCGPHSNV